MNQQRPQHSRTKKFTPLGIIFAVAGLLLFVYFVRKAGIGQIWANLQQLGPLGFLLILLLSAARPVVRCLAWTRCFEAPHSLRFRDAFNAYLIGDTMGNLVPLGIFVSEPTKAALVRERVPLVAGLSALAVENLFYSLSVMLFIFSGTAAMLLSFPLTKGLRTVSFIILIGVLAIIPLGFLVIRKQWKFLSGTLEFLYGRGIGRRFLETKRERVSSLEDRIYGFYQRNSSRFLQIMLCEACFHLAGVAEVYLTLYFIIDKPTLLSAFVLESVNRVINVVFKFVPMRVGVDEAGSGWVTKVLTLGLASGTTLAIIRKARVLFWTAVGVALLVRRGLSVRAVAKQTEEAVAREVNAAPQSNA